MMFLVPLVFAALVVSVASNDATCKGCETFIDAAYSHDVQNYAEDLQKFKNFYDSECNFFLNQIDPALGEFCFSLFSRNEGAMHAAFQKHVPTGILCTNLKECSSGVKENAKSSLYCSMCEHVMVQAAAANASQHIATEVDYWNFFNNFCQNLFQKDQQVGKYCFQLFDHNDWIVWRGFKKNQLPKEICAACGQC